MVNTGHAPNLPPPRAVSPTTANRQPSTASRPVPLPPWIAALDLDRPSDGTATATSLPPRRLWPSAPMIREALEAVRASLEPASPERVIAELMRLRLHLPMRDVSATEARLMLEDYLSDLGAIPADVLVGAIAEARRSCRWFPSIAELLAFARPALQRRHGLARRLERMATLSTMADEAPSLDERTRIAAGLRGLARRWRALDPMGRGEAGP